MIKNIIFDFDGVILDSMPVRDFGFREIFKTYDDALIEKLIEFHQENGGLSRFVKIRYFYEELLNQEISDDKIKEYTENFSLIMKNELTKKQYLIETTVNFIKNNFQEFNLHIASGSEHTELNFLCQKLELDQCFLTINGSPEPKNSIVKNILENYEYEKSETILIGDSINDYDAAKINGIDFYGFNNKDLQKYSKDYINTFEEMSFNG